MLVEDRQCYLLFLSVWGYMVNDTKWGKPGLTPPPGKKHNLHTRYKNLYLPSSFRTGTLAHVMRASIST